MQAQIRQRDFIFAASLRQEGVYFFSPTCTQPHVEHRIVKSPRSQGIRDSSIFFMSIQGWGILQ